MTLWFVATPESYRSVCSRFNIGESTGHRVVKRVIKAIYKFSPFFIKWPTANEAVTSMNAFEMQYNVPGVIGAIDGTHIRITPPKTDPAAYVNRKLYHSIVAQIVCDHKLKFIHCYVGEPGSVHDSRVLRKSNLPQRFHLKYFPNDSHLLGDAAYGISRYILTPFRDDGHLTRQQKNFNYCHSATRMIAERSIGLLKIRERRILERLMMFRTDLIPEFVVSLCVLHNINIERNNLENIPLVRLINDLPIGDCRREEGVQKRENIALNLPMRI